MRVQAVLFDNDGTLVDTERAIMASFEHATRSVLGHAADAGLFRSLQGRPLDEQMWHFAADEREHERLVTEYRAHNAQVIDHMISLFDGVAEGLARLQEAGLPMAVVTAKRHDVCLHGLEVLGVDGRFRAIVGAEDCTRHKPDPLPVLIAAEQLGVAPERCLMVGDSPYDMQAGLDAGTLTAAALWGIFPREKLEPFHPTCWCDSFSRVVEFALQS